MVAEQRQAESRRQVRLWGRSAAGQQGTAYPTLYLPDKDPGTEDQLLAVSACVRRVSPRPYLLFCVLANVRARLGDYF